MTPNVANNENAKTPGFGISLLDQVATLPTPRMSDHKSSGGIHGEGGPDLRHVAENLLPTPAASNPNDGENVDGWLARRERVKETARNGNGMGVPLGVAVALLPTPVIEPATGNGHARNLATETALIPTPSVADVQGGRATRSGARSDELLLNGLAARERFGEYAAAILRHEHLVGRPAPAPTERRGTPLTKGGGALDDQRKPRLSARFIEWMMCLPDGWVTDTPGLSRSQQLALLGNGVAPPQAVAALTHLLNIERTRP